MTPLVQILTALEHVRPYVTGVAVEQEVSAALTVARHLVEEGIAARVKAAVAEMAP